MFVVFKFPVNLYQLLFERVGLLDRFELKVRHPFHQLKFLVRSESPQLPDLLVHRIRFNFAVFQRQVH